VGSDLTSKVCWKQTGGRWPRALLLKSILHPPNTGAAQGAFGSGSAEVGATPGENEGQERGGPSALRHSGRVRHEGLPPWGRWRTANKRRKFEFVTGIVRSDVRGRACGYGPLRGSRRRCRITRCRTSAIPPAQLPLIGVLVEESARQAPDMSQKDHTHFMPNPGPD
jgi:hypothetical protein